MEEQIEGVRGELKEVDQLMEEDEGKGGGRFGFTGEQEMGLEIREEEEEWEVRGFAYSTPK